MSHAPSLLFPSQQNTAPFSNLSTCTPVRPTTRPSSRPPLTSSSHADFSCAGPLNSSFGPLPETTSPTEWWMCAREAQSLWILLAPCVRRAKEALWWNCRSSKALFSPWMGCDNKKKDARRDMKEKERERRALLSCAGWPGSQVKVTYHLYHYGIEVRVEFLKSDGSQTWMVICKGMNKCATKLAESGNLFTAKRWLPVRRDPLRQNRRTVESTITFILKDVRADRYTEVERHSCRRLRR